jgi:hypothetical protein
LVLLAGCAAKKTVSSQQTGFRFHTLPQGTLLFAPAIPESQSDDNSIKLVLNGNATVPNTPTACSASNGPFKLERTETGPTSAAVLLPSPADWLRELDGLREPDGSGGIDSLYSFLGDLDRSQQVGCFAEAKFAVREYVLQSIPMKPSESLFNAYGYRLERSGLDLKPGLRLKIDRAYFGPAKEGGEKNSEKNYLGVSTFNISVDRESDGKIRFQQIGDLKYTPESVKHSGGEGIRDTGLKELPGQSNFRVLFYTYVVPKEQRVFAAVIGAETASRLDELEQQLRTNSEEGCKIIMLSSAESCFEFKGFVTVTAQINVELNGQTVFIDWGTKLSRVLPKESLNSLRIQRLFMDTYYDVSFDPLKPEVLSLALIGGDRLTWTKGKALVH